MKVVDSKKLSDPLIITDEKLRELTRSQWVPFHTGDPAVGFMSVESLPCPLWYRLEFRERCEDYAWSSFCNGWILIWWAAFVGRA